MDVDYFKEIVSIINTVLINNGKPPIVSIQTDSDLRDVLDFDSFDLAELTVRIQAKFNVDVFEGLNVRTIADIIKKIQK